MKTVGIDIGGTATKIGIVDISKGKIIKKITIPTKLFKDDKKNLNHIVKKTIEIIDLEKIKNIGIGVPELINNKGIIRGNYNFAKKLKRIPGFPNYFPVITHPFPFKFFFSNIFIII